MGQGTDKGDKAVMKANTAALKYALAGIFLISWGDDPEADVETDKYVVDPKAKTRRDAYAMRAKQLSSDAG